MRLFRFCFAIFIAALSLNRAAHAADAIVQTPNARVSLVASTRSVAPGEKSWIGLRIEHQPHWHTYWRNPGESGLPTSIVWENASGASIGDFAWPTPKRVFTGGLTNYGYEDDLVLPIALDVPAGQREPMQLRAKATWLICKEVCIPEEGVVSLTLPIASGAGAASDHKARIDAALAAQPVALPSGASVSIERDVANVLVRVSSGIAQPLKSAYFYPYNETVIAHSAPQAIASGDGGIAISMNLAPNAPIVPTLDGVLEINGKGFVVPATKVASVGLTRAPVGWQTLTTIEVPTKPALPPENFGGVAGDFTLWSAIAFAFIGGMILNLMPCVFPVLSIKILGFAQHAGEDKSAMRAHGLAYSVGVIASFLVLAGALLAVRAAGSNVGWGFQLQHPVVIGVLAIVFLLIGLNLLGVFEFQFAPQVDAKETKSPVVNAFLSGVLAVVAASPCTAPFMGAALGFALTQSPIFSLAIFAALGVGMALPYAILAWFPAWLKKLPRPGPWMNTMKKWLSLPMFATVAWLGWVLWLQLAPAPAPSAQLAQMQSAWKPWNDAMVAQTVASGKPVFVDYTAAWCVSCQANKKLVLETDTIARAFAAKNVTLMRADWTKQDPLITDSLKALGRSGVPVYVLHRPGKAPLVLPEVLTAGIVEDALKTL